MRKLSRDDKFIPHCNKRITLVPDGIPLVADGKTVGSIGVGGCSKEQESAADR